MSIEYAEQSWVDGSSGGTPINASRLGHMEDGIKAACDGVDDDKWQSGDTMNATGLYTGGYITSGGTAVRFSIPLNRQVADGVTASPNGDWTVTVRSEGGYEIGTSSGAGTVDSDDITLAVRSGWIGVSITSSKLSTNNVAIGVVLGSSPILFT